MWHLCVTLQLNHMLLVLRINICERSSQQIAAKWGLRNLNIILDKLLRLNRAGLIPYRLNFHINVKCGQRVGQQNSTTSMSFSLSFTRFEKQTYCYQFPHAASSLSRLIPSGPWKLTPTWELFISIKLHPWELLPWQPRPQALFHLIDGAILPCGR